MSETNEARWVSVAATEAVPEGEARTFEVEGERVAVARVEGALYAVQDLCTHDDGPLGEGRVCGFAIQCPRHGAQFDVRTGAVLSMPAIVPIRTYPVREQDGRVQIALPESEPVAATDDGDDW